MELNIVLLCFATALCTFAFITKAKPDWNPEELFSKKKVYYGIAAALFIVAVFVRVWKFGEVPAGMNQDGAMAAVDAYALATHGTDRLGTRLPVYFEAWGYGQMSVLLSYLMVPFIKLFGLSSTTARLPMLLASIAGIVVAFKFMEKLFGRTAALATLLIIAINPWHIMQSRWALDCNLLPHFLLFSVYFLYLGLNRRGFLYLSMVFFGLTMYTYGIAFITIPLLLIALCAYLIVKKRIKPWEAILSAVIYLYFAWPIFAVVIINTFKLHTLDTGFITMQYFPASIRTNDLLFYAKDFFGQLLSNIRSMTDMAILEKGDFSWNYIKDYGQMYLYTLPFIITGLWLLFRRASVKAAGADEAEQNEAKPPDNAGRVILIAWLAVAIFTGLMVNGVNTNRINIIFYPLCILAALGVWHIAFDAARIKKIALAVAIITVLSFSGFTAAYFGEHSRTLAKEFCNGFTQAVQQADNMDADVLYITSNSRSEGAYTCSEIYTLFGAAIDSEYFQGKADAYSKTGKKLLPYSRRYRYVDLKAFDISEPSNAVFVINREESFRFEQAGFDIMMFDGFGVAVKNDSEKTMPADDDKAVG